MGELTNFWELYGLRENPFSTSPILVKGGTMPVESFIGRKAQLELLKKLFRSAGGSRILVYGEIGIGKTSFVNVARHDALMKGFFTPFKEIAVQEHWNTDSFVLNTLAGIYSTIKLMQSKPVNEQTFKKLESLIEFGREEVNVGLSVGGTGGNYEKHISHAPEISTTSLIEFFQEISTEIIKNTNQDMVIHYNNLELLPENSLKRIFNNLRDFFQIPHIHFVFVGNLTVHSVVQTIPRFSSILSDSILIENLSIQEVREIIQTRLKYLRMSEELNYVVPFREEVLESLYKLYSGNIRNILNSLSAATTEVTKERSVILDHLLLARTLKSIAENRLGGLQKRARQVLLEAVKHEEVTNRHLSRQTKIARSNVSTYIGQLQQKGCIYLRRKDGKDKFWSVDPKIKWLLLKETDKKQKRMYDYGS